MQLPLRIIVMACVLVGGTPLPTARAQETAGEAPEADDVETWRRLGAPLWRFDSTGVEAGPEDALGYLVSREAIPDFRLSLEFWVAANTNSGVFVRCGEIHRVEDVNPDNCYEINIWDEHPNQAYRTGSIVKHVVPTAFAESVGRWNRLDIDARKGAISVRVNDEVTAELDGTDAGAGLVALQYAGSGLLRFRKIEIEAD